MTQRGLLSGAGATRRVVILDNSRSMGLDPETFLKAKELARELLSAQGDREAAILATSGGRFPARLLTGGLSRQELEKIALSHGGADYLSAFKAAFALLSGDGGQSEIILLTDLARGGWDRLSLERLDRYDPTVPLRIVDVASPTRRGFANAAIRSVSVRGGVMTAGYPAVVVVKGLSFSDRGVSNLLLQFFIGETKADQRVFSLGGKGEWEQEMQVTPRQAGSQAGLVRLSGDGLLGNLDHHLTLEVQERIGVFLVDGDPKTSISQSETFFLAKALRPGGLVGASGIDPQVLSPEELLRASLGNVGAIFLCNVPSLSKELRENLVGYVQRGGGIVFFLGDRVKGGETNQILHDFLPARLGEIQRGRRARLKGIDRDHALLTSFSLEDLASVVFQSHFGVETPSAGVKTLLTLEGGSPLLLEKRYGAGKVLLFTSSADRDWNDFSIQASYVPFVQGLARYLAGASSESIAPTLSVGEPKEFAIEKRFSGSLARVASPRGREEDLVLASRGEQATATFTHHDLPGQYRFSLPGRVITYSVNTPLEELETEPLPESLIRERFRPASVEILHAGNQGSIESGLARKDLSREFLLFLVAILLLEGVVSHKVSWP
jgi:hypothetical protein